MKQRAPSTFSVTTAVRFDGPRHWLLLLLLAAPLDAFASSAANAPNADWIARDFATASNRAHYPATRDLVRLGEHVTQTVSSPFFATRAGVQLADNDNDDHRAVRKRFYPGRHGDRSADRAENPELRRRFEALPPDQRQRLIETRERFLHLPPEDRERLRQRWRDMSPEDRRRWRESASHRD